MVNVTNYGSLPTREYPIEAIADSIREHFTEEEYRVREFQNDFMRWADDGGRGGEL